MRAFMSISLTIVIPTLNSAKTLSTTLISLEPLARAGAKIIVVDSNSLDESVVIARKFGVILREVPPGNMYHAINDGLMESDTEWHTYLNSDDILYADSVLIALEKLGAKSDVVYGSIDFIDEFGRFLHSWTSPPPQDVLAISSRAMAIPQPGTLFRRSVTEKLRGFDLEYRYSSDFDFFLRANLAGFHFARLDHPRIASFRVHSGQTSRAKRKEMCDELRRSIKCKDIEISKISCIRAYLAWRLRNWDSYALRILRTRQLTGRIKINSTLGG